MNNFFTPALSFRSSSSSLFDDNAFFCSSHAHLRSVSHTWADESAIFASDLRLQQLGKIHGYPRNMGHPGFIKYSDSEINVWYLISHSYVMTVETIVSHLGLNPEKSELKGYNVPWRQMHVQGKSNKICRLWHDVVCPSGRAVANTVEDGVHSVSVTRIWSCL